LQCTLARSWGLPAAAYIRTWVPVQWYIYVRTYVYIGICIGIYVRMYVHTGIYCMYIRIHTVPAAARCRQRARGRTPPCPVLARVSIYTHVCTYTYCTCRRGDVYTFSTVYIYCIYTCMNAYELYRYICVYTYMYCIYTVCIYVYVLYIFGMNTIINVYGVASGATSSGALPAACARSNPAMAPCRCAASVMPCMTYIYWTTIYDIYIYGTPCMTCRCAASVMLCMHGCPMKGGYGCFINSCMGVP